MATPRALRGAALAAALLALAVGCRSGTAPLAEVRGKVTYRGEPLRGGTVVFTPDASRGTTGEPAAADIQPDGSYTLKTADSAGAAVGWHRVTVLALVPAAGPPPAGQRFTVPLSALPLKYREPHLSGLSCEVKAGGPNTIDVRLD
jgi:hypothetical protein